MGVEGVALEYHGNGRAWRAGWCLTQIACDPDFPCRRVLKTGDDAQKGGFAATRGADKDHEFAFLDIDVDGSSTLQFCRRTCICFSGRALSLRCLREIGTGCPVRMLWSAARQIASDLTASSMWRVRSISSVMAAQDVILFGGTQLVVARLAGEIGPCGHPGVCGSEGRRPWCGHRTSALALLLPSTMDTEPLGGDDVFDEKGGFGHHRPPACFIPAHRIVPRRRPATGHNYTCPGRSRRKA